MEPVNDPSLYSVREAEFQIYGVTVKAYLLNNGDRVVDVNTFEDMVDAIAADGGKMGDAWPEMGALVDWLSISHDG